MIALKGFLACCLPLSPASGLYSFICTKVHGLDTLDEDNWKLFVLL